MQTIVELPEFLRKSCKLLRGSERQDIINYLALHPEFGKGEKANISKGERNELATLTSLLVKNYGG